MPFMPDMRLFRKFHFCGVASVVVEPADESLAAKKPRICAKAGLNLAEIVAASASSSRKPSTSQHVARPWIFAVARTGDRCRAAAARSGRQPEPMHPTLISLWDLGGE